MSSITVVMENVSYLASMVTAGALAYTAWRGGVALSNWQDEKRFGKNLEFALKIMDITYRVRVIIDDVRFPFKTPVELYEAKENMDRWIKPVPESGDSKEAINAQVILDRLKKHEGIEDEILECLSMAHAIFGDDVEKALKDLRMSFVHLSSSAYMIILKNRSGNNGSQDDDYFLKNLFINRKEETDDFEREVQFQIEKIRNACQPVIGRITGDINNSRLIYRNIKKSFFNFLKRIFYR